MKNVIRKFTVGHPSHMLRPTLWLFIESSFMGFPAVAAYFAIHFIVAGFTQPANIDSLWMVAVVMGMLTVVQLFISTGTFLNTYLPATVHNAENKQGFIKKLRTLPLGYFLKKESGELINTFTGDFLAVEQSMVGMFTGIWAVVISCIFTGVILFLFNPVMALALYICVPLSVLVIALSMNLTTKLTRKNIEARDHAATYLNEYLLGMKTLKAYNQTGEGFGKLKDAYRSLQRVNLHGETVSGTLMSLANTFVQAGLPLMCFAGAYMLLGGRLSVVDYLGIIVIGTKVISPVLTWVRYMVLLRSHYVSAGRIDDVMQATAMQGNGKTNARHDIRFENVSFAYSGKKSEEVLKDVSFTIPVGKLTAIVGPSGGGKSTILRLIARFWDVGDGKISCDNKALADLDAEAWVENISMVLQDVYLFHDTIRENILFGRKDASEKEMIDAAERAQCHDFIMALPEGYDTVVGEGGSTLSGGEKQRISIARAILKNAPILLLDEPTASLDAKNEVLIQRAISGLVRDRTVVMIAHRLKTVQHAHQILVLEDGQVTGHGTHDDLMAKKGTYHRLWNLQNQSMDWDVTQ
ncbi:MAG: ABC transporter ATP-binding protein [Suipraeoptans sp.]